MTFYILAGIILAGLLIYVVFVKPPKRKGYVDIRVGDKIEVRDKENRYISRDISHIIYENGIPVKFRLQIYSDKSIYINVNSTSYINLSALEREQKQREEILKDLVKPLILWRPFNSSPT